MELVFQNGEEATCMYFVKTGRFRYRRHADIVAKKAYFAEGALWTKWCHRGDLVCCSELGHVVTIVPASFGKVLRSHIEPFDCAKRYGQDFVRHLNSMTSSKLSDVTLLELEWLGKKSSVKSISFSIIPTRT